MNGNSTQGQVQLPISAAQLIQPSQTQQSMAQASLAQNPAQLQKLLFQQHVMQQQNGIMPIMPGQLQQILSQQQVKSVENLKSFLF